MKDFYTCNHNSCECEADDFCDCTVCARNKYNGGSCNNCLSCSNGSRQSEDEPSCFVALKTVAAQRKEGYYECLR